MIVLGREQHSKGWAGSLRWSEFGGHASHEDDKSPVATAVREFHEETLGVLGDVKPILDRDEYSFHIVVRRRLKGAEHVKYFYVVKLPYDASVEKRFYGRREHLKQILFTVARIREVQRALFRQRLPVPDYYHKFDLEASEMVRSAVCVEQREDGSMWSVVVTHRDGAVLPHSHRVNAAQAAQYAQLITLKNSLDRLIQAFPADVARDAVIRKLRAGEPSWLPFVKREYLEKDRVGFFSPEQLLRANDVRLRTSFVMPLNLVLQQLLYAQAYAKRAL